MICRNRPIRIFNRSINDSFASGATATVIMSCSGMERLTFRGFFTTVPATAPTVSLSEDGVNWDDVESLTLAPGQTSLYRAEINLHGAAFVRLVVTAGPGGGDSARANAWLWPTPDANAD